MCAFLVFIKNDQINIRCLLTVANKTKSNLFPARRGPVVTFL